MKHTDTLMRPGPERVRFPGTRRAQELSGRLRLPADKGVAGAAVLCHPHPAYGGNMDVWLLPSIAERLAAANWAALRFDFRSADEAEATDDLAAAVAYVRERAPEADRLALVGWSFGALIAMLYGPTDPAVTDWVGIGAPTRVVPDVNMPPPPDHLDRWEARRTVIVGEHDQFYPPDTTDVLAPHRVIVVPGTDHFFIGRDREVADLVAEALA
jgi:uncharacterized protein